MTGFESAMTRTKGKMSEMERTLKASAKQMQGAFDALGVASKTYEGTTGELMNKINALGAEQKSLADKMINGNDRIRGSIFQTIGAMNNMTTASSKVQSMTEKSNASLRQLDGIFLGLTGKLESFANKTNVASMALEALGPKASNKDLVDYINNANAGIGRFHATLLATGIGATAFYGTLGKLAMQNKSVADSVNTMGANVKKAFGGLIDMMGGVITHVSNFVTKIAQMKQRFDEAHPTISKLADTFMLVAPAIATILSPLAIGIARFGSFKLAVSSLINMLKPLIVGIGAITGPTLLVAGAIAAAVVSFVEMYKHSEQLRTTIANLWSALKGGIMEAIQPLKSAFQNLFSTIVGEGGSASSFWQNFGNVVSQVLQTIGSVVIPAVVLAVKMLATQWGTSIRLATEVVKGLLKVGSQLKTQWEGLGASKFLLIGNPIGMIAVAVKALGDAFNGVLNPSLQFGESINASTQKAVTGYMNLDTKATQALTNLQVTGQTVTTATANQMINTFGQMGDKITAEMTKDHNEQLTTMQSFFDRSKVMSTTQEASLLQNLTNSNAQKQAKIQEYENRIAQIMNTAKEQKRGITQAEANEISQIQAQMRQTAVKHMSDSEVEQKAIMARLNTYTGEVSAQQSAKIVQESLKAKDGAVKHANERYNQEVAEIIRLRDEAGAISAEQADKMIQEAGRQKDETIKKATEQHTKIVDEAKKQADEHVNQVNWETGEVLNGWETFKQNMATKWSEIKKNALDAWTQMKNDGNTQNSQLKNQTNIHWSEIGQKISSKAQEISSNVSKKWGEIQSNTASKWASVKSDITSKFENAKSSVTSKASQLASTLSSKFGSISSTGKSKFDSLKNGIVNAVSNAKDKIGDLVSKIKGFFDRLKLKVPRPSLPTLPHFKLKTAHKTVLGKDIEYPTGFSVDWYKTGGIFTGASLVGVGEAGDEAVLPLSNKHRMAPFAKAVASMMPDNTNNTSATSKEVGQTVIEGNNFYIREEADINKVARDLYRLQQRGRRN